MTSGDLVAIDNGIAVPFYKVINIVQNRILLAQNIIIEQNN